MKEKEHRVRPDRTARARELRHEQTKAEDLVWWQVRARRLAKYKFRRQRPIGKYVVDFVCMSHKLVVELDGRSHESGEAVVHDEERDAWLRARGYRVIRFGNDEVY